MQAPADQVPEGEGLLDRVMTAVQTHIRENGLQVGDELPSEGAFSELTGRTVGRQR